MSGPKPLVFDKVVAPVPAAAKPAGGPKPLSFPPSQKPVVKPPAAVVAPLRFDNVVVPVKTKASPQPKAIGSPVPPTIHAGAIAAFRTTYPDLFRQEELKVIRQIQQLLPLKVEVILDWGTMTLERMRDISTEATAFVTQFVQADGNDLIKRAIDGLNGAQSSGLLSKLFSRAPDPISIEPSLVVLQTQLSPWLKRCDELIATAQDRAGDVAIKLASLSSVADSIDQITDNTIDQAVTNRRLILQQGSMQASFTVQSLRDIRGQIIDQKMRVDQVLTVTLPAYKAAKARG